MSSQYLLIISQYGRYGGSIALSCSIFFIQESKKHNFHLLISPLYHSFFAPYLYTEFHRSTRYISSNIQKNCVQQKIFHQNTPTSKCLFLLVIFPLYGIIIYRNKTDFKWIFLIYVIQKLPKKTCTKFKI